MVDGVAIKRHSILAGIGGIAGLAVILRRRKSHTLYIVLPKVHLGKRQKHISRKPVRAKRVFHTRTLGGVKVKGDGKARSPLGGVSPPLNQAELRDGRRRCCTGRPNGEAAFDAHEPTRGLARRANPCERIPTDRAHRRASHEREGPENTFPPITMRSEPPMRSASRARSARTIAIRDVNPPKPHPYP